MRCAAATALGLLLGWPALARAQGADDDHVNGTGPGPVDRSASVGTFLPLTHAAAVRAQSAAAAANGGYDGARHGSVFEATAEVRVWGPLAVRAGAVATGSDNRLRPSFGARVQVLREQVHGLDAAAGAFYRPEGLTEAEGEIETVLSAGLHLGRAYLLGNLVYGQDPEGNERDGEVRLAALHPVHQRVLLGLDGRLRFDLGSSNAGKGEPTLDALVGPTATLLLGRFALLAHGGASIVRMTSTSYGPFIMGGLGSSF